MNDITAHVIWQAQLQPSADALRDHITRCGGEGKPPSAGIDAALLEDAERLYGNKCTQHGFIVAKTITIHTRTLGLFVPEHFDGTPKFGVELKAMAIKPVPGMRLTDYHLLKYTPTVGAECYAWPMIIFIPDSDIRRQEDLTPEVSVIVLNAVDLRLEEPIKCVGTLVPRGHHSE